MSFTCPKADANPIDAPAAPPLAFVHFIATSNNQLAFGYLGLALLDISAAVRATDRIIAKWRSAGNLVIKMV